MSDELADFITRQNIFAQNSAVGNIDADPEKGARALELSKQTGIDAQAIYGDVEGFEKQHKAALTQQLIRGNPILTDYVNSHPLASVVSNDDMGQLDEVSQRIRKLPGAKILAAPSDALEAGVKGFYQGFTAEGKLGKEVIRTGPDYPLDEWLATNHPYLWQNLAGVAQLAGVPKELFDRTMAGFVGGAGAAVQSAARSFGADEASVARLPEDVARSADFAMQAGMGLHVPEAAEGVYKSARPFVENGEKPPVGAHPLIDKLYQEQAKEDIGNLDDLFKETQKSATRERAPELFEDFVRSHTDASIGISAEAVRKLYGDKIPEADDNLLGWVEGLQEQLVAAEQYGGDVQVPLAQWLARVDPEVAKALKDDIRVRKDGMTVNETKPKETEGDETTLTKKAEPEEKPAPIDQLDAVRRPAGLDPVAAPGQMRLTRVPFEAGEAESPKVHEFDIEDAQGKRQGGVFISESPDGKELNVQSVAAGSVQGIPGFLGQRQLTGLLRQLQQEFPNAETISGFRISGARAEAGTTREVTIPLRPTEKQITDFMRSGYEAQPVRGYEGKIVNVQPIYSTTVGENAQLKQLVENSKDPVAQKFGEKILELTKDTPIHVITNDDIIKAFGKTVGGFHQQYMNGKNNIFISDRLTHWSPEDVARVVVHEASHAASVAAIESFPELKAKIRSLMNEVSEGLTDRERKTHDYAFTNEKEFIAESQSRDDFRELMKSIGLSPELIKDLGEQPANAWEAFKNIVKELWEKLTGKKVEQSALGAMLELSEEIWKRQEEVLARGYVGVRAPELAAAIREGTEAPKAANDVGLKRETAKTYEAATKQQQVERFGKNAEIGDFNYWKKKAIDEGHTAGFGPRRPNAYIAARETSKGGKTTIIIRQDGARSVFHNGVRVVREGRKDIISTDAAQRPTQLELPGLTRMEDREAFEKATAIGMTVKQYRRYQELIAKRDQEDMDHFRTQAEKRERLRQTAEWKAEEERIRKEVRQDLQGRPDIAADAMLREGSYLGDKLKGRPRLDSDKLTAEQKAALPDDYHKPGGVNPDDTATMFGYHSADHMIQGIKDLHVERGELGPNEHLNKVAEGLTQERMKREFGNLEQNILEETKDHVISPTQLDILHEEIVALASKYGDELSFSKSDIKTWVKKQFAEMPISMHDTDVYLAAAGRAGRGAEQALLDNDGREAFKFKQQQYISMQMANEAKAYEKQRTAFDKIAKRVRNPKYGGMENNYLAHLRNQLGNAGLPTGKTVQGLADDVAAAGDLSKFTQSESNMKGIQILLPDWVYAGEKIPLEKMTYEQFRGLHDTVVQLYKLGREDKSFDTRAGKFALREVIDNKAIPQLAKQGETGTPYNIQGIAKLTNAAKEIFYGKLVQVFSVFNRWDIGDKHGFFNSNVTYVAAAADSGYSAKLKEYSAKLNEAFKPIADLDLKKPLPNLLKRASRNEMVNMTMENAQRVIMDMGNPSNRNKFLRGWKVDEGQLWQWLKNNTTKEMWDTWQKVGDLNAEAFADLREMIRDQNGVVPDLVELEPFTDPHGVQRKGWYSPMIYDQKELGASRAAEGLHAVNPEELGGLFDTGYFKSTTATGSEIRRTSYAAPTDLTMNRLPQRMQQILYDTAFRPFVINFSKMLRDTDFRHAIERHAGEPVLHMMDDWLRDIVGGGKGVSTVSDQYLSRISEFFRRNLIGSMIGWNVHTAEKHGLTAAVTSLAEVGPVNFAREVKSLFATSPDGFKTNFNFAISKSLELQRRFQTMRETLGGQFEGLRFNNKGFWAARDWMLEKGSFLVGWSDMMSSVPSWLAEYKKQMAALGEKFPNKLPQEYEGTAIEIADSIVRRAHGSTAITSRPGAMRGGAMGRLFTSLYSVFNQMLQRNFEAYWRTKYAKDNYDDLDYGQISGHLGKAALLVATSTLWPVLVEHMVTPDLDKKKQSWAGKIGEYLAEGATLGVPVAREVVHGYLTSREAGAGMLDSGLKEISSSFADIAKGADAMDKEHGGKTIKDFTSLIGLLTAVPGEAGNILEEIWNAMHHSKQAPRNPAEVYRATTTGRATGQPDLIQRGVVEPLTGTQGRRK